VAKYLAISQLGAQIELRAATMTLAEQLGKPGQRQKAQRERCRGPLHPTWFLLGCTVRPPRRKATLQRLEDQLERGQCHYFKIGSAELSSNFREELTKSTLEAILKLIKQFDVDVIEVVGTNSRLPHAPPISIATSYPC
jgi:hypothetical protein